MNKKRALKFVSLFTTVSFLIGIWIVFLSAKNVMANSKVSILFTSEYGHITFINTSGYIVRKKCISVNECADVITDSVKYVKDILTYSALYNVTNWKIDPIKRFTTDDWHILIGLSTIQFLLLFIVICISYSSLAII